MANYNSKHTGSQIDSAVTRALSGGAIDQDIAKKMDATESTDYPGCYYRMSNNVKEWLNPPMVVGTEYCTTERYKNKPVYAKVVDCGTLPNTGQKDVYFTDETKTTECVFLSIWNQYVGFTIPDGISVKAWARRNYIALKTESDLSTYTGTYALVKYIYV